MHAAVYLRTVSAHVLKFQVMVWVIFVSGSQISTAGVFAKGDIFGLVNRSTTVAEVASSVVECATPVVEGATPVVEGATARRSRHAATAGRSRHDATAVERRLVLEGRIIPGVARHPVLPPFVFEVPAQLGLVGLLDHVLKAAAFIRRVTVDIAHLAVLLLWHH